MILDPYVYEDREFRTTLTTKSLLFAVAFQDLSLVLFYVDDLITLMIQYLREQLSDLKLLKMILYKVDSIHVVNDNDVDRQSMTKRTETIWRDAYQRDSRYEPSDLTNIWYEVWITDHSWTSQVRRRANIKLARISSYQVRGNWIRLSYSFQRRRRQTQTENTTCCIWVSSRSYLLQEYMENTKVDHVFPYDRTQRIYWERKYWRY